MISDKMRELVKSSSVIRAMFEEGKRLEAIHGKDNVFDYSLGNPSAPPPAAIKNAVDFVLGNDTQAEIHGYMNNSGFHDVRARIASHINKEQGTSLKDANIVMTCGAAGGLNVLLKCLLNPGDEVIIFAPYFGEYINYTKNFDGVPVIVPADTETFQPDLKAFEELITERTRAVIINSPNNPSGAVYSDKTLTRLSEVLNRAQRKHDNPIYLISDEPYRAIVYKGVTVPYVTKFYDNAFVAYSFSKALSLPGERIGYIVAPDTLTGGEEILSALNVATRILGYVNAPSLFQKVVAKCLDVKVDMAVYEKNMNTLYDALTTFGFHCFKPQGAFYMFPKAPGGDGAKFCQAAKAHNLLLVPGGAFGCPEFFRLAFCVEHKMILKSLDAFEKVAWEFK